MLPECYICSVIRFPLSCEERGYLPCGCTGCEFEESWYTGDTCEGIYCDDEKFVCDMPEHIKSIIKN